MASLQWVTAGGMRSPVAVVVKLRKLSMLPAHPAVVLVMRQL
jgi:hypothetical protein